MTQGNQERADRAQIALDVYQALDGMDPDTEGALSDLMCDLLHLAEREREEDVQFPSALRLQSRALTNFEDEQGE